jgi:hypothetical protein
MGALASTCDVRALFWVFHPRLSHPNSAPAKLLEVVHTGEKVLHRVVGFFFASVGMLMRVTLPTRTSGQPRR